MPWRADRIVSESFALEPPPEKRDHLDRYYTPSWVTKALLEHLTHVWQPRDQILEPCAGQGGVADVLDLTLGTDGVWFRVMRADIDPAADPRNEVRDFLSSDDTHELDHTLRRADGFTIWPQGWRSFDWVITNPPYALKSGAKASDFVRQAFTLAPRVAMLLRLSWLEPCPDRLKILQLRPPQMVIILPRVSFAGPHGKKGTDSVTSAWFVWDDTSPLCGDAQAHCLRRRMTQIVMVPKSDVARLNGQADLFGVKEHEI